MSVFVTVKTFFQMIKFSHSVFAGPFALVGAALAAKTHGIEWEQVLWILVALVSARSAAMGFNRLADRKLDAQNPRTRNRALPRALITPRAVFVIMAIWCTLFVYAAYQLNSLCLYLSPIALLIILSYSYFKRFTWATHLVLGIALGIAPMGAWVAVTGSFDLEPLWLTAAVLTWVAGFDIIYACQDYTFDVSHGVYSIPSRLGIRLALTTARLFHLGTVLALLVIYYVFQLHALYLCGTALVAGFLIYEHRLVRADDLSKIDLAFFTTNGLISVVYFLFTLGDILWTK